MSNTTGAIKRDNKFNFSLLSQLPDKSVSSTGRMIIITHSDNEVLFISSEGRFNLCSKSNESNEMFSIKENLLKLKIGRFYL